MNPRHYAYSEDSQTLGRALEMLDSGEAFLEIGAGRGGNLDLVEKKFKLVAGTDLIRAPTKSRSGNAEIVVADRATCFRRNSFDVVAFNPPYVPTEIIEDRTVDGGHEGIEVPLLFLSSALEVVKPNGRILMLLSSSDSITVVEQFCKMQHLGIEKKVERKLFFESLFVFELTKTHQQKTSG